MSPFKNKLVAVMNESVEQGTVMNALAHMCIGFGAKLGDEELQLMDYVDADGNAHPNISKMPFIILKANSNKLRNLRLAALQEGISFVVFTDTMTVGTWEEQAERTLQTPEANLKYYGVVLYGDWEKVTAITRKFSLWK